MQPVYFYTPCKYEKTYVFIVFLEGIEKYQWHVLS